jgi:protein-S-isoprenylcysteine O-methyltransferase Ste14
VEGILSLVQFLRPARSEVRADMLKPVPTPAPAWVIACGDFLFKYRNFVFPALFATIVLFAGRSWTSARVDDALDVAGVVLAVLGQGLRALVIGLAYIKRGGLNKKVHANSLVTGGIFSACRNPLYIGNALILFGLLLICNALSAYLIAGGFFIFTYWSIVRTEETFLLQKFGEQYAAYCRRTNRWLPDPARMVEVVRTMGFNWRRVLMKDYSTVVSWLLAAAVLDGYEEALRGGGLTRSLFVGLAAQVTLLLACCAFVRWLKKSGRLTETA